MKGTGTIVVTGSNGSLAIPLVEHLLTTFPQYTLLLAVRNPSSEDIHTRQLRNVVKPHSHRVHIGGLDLARLSDVKKYVESVVTDIRAKKLPPLTSIICNAFYWNLTGEVIATPDGFEQTWQVTYLAHAALILGLLPSFNQTPDEARGRIILLSSDAHLPGKNGLEVYPPVLPGDLESLRVTAKSSSSSSSSPSKDDNPLGRGFHRYAVAKLAVTTWMYALNAHLEATTGPLQKVTALAVNPGNLSDSRALRVNTPAKLQFISRFIIKPLRPLLQYKDHTMRTSAEAALDIADLAVGPDFAGAKGYFTWKKPDTSSPESLDPEKQKQLWEKTLEWLGLGENLPL
ncbi:hypothetical protein ASPBRDRAFT_116822 [Aspergillus brasiliensis CBS 101740]|uniref:Ketoreductase (KR) domain-containing protein n=1 Tax=Aspergillus brasiliensis (strain CBS 101740 / IMI 381727 / IBT 21946) TaxID=767769 RepID=A0A1L9UVZ0_ASPBC|nr:hypothetical protein ASPBRDRAFT_116822 [Aspergillus brasiliensis CBS 101740]